jgi:hypothetical protein
VEHQVWDVGENIPWSAAVCERALSWTLSQGWVQRSWQCSALRSSQGLAQAQTIHLISQVPDPSHLI